MPPTQIFVSVARQSGRKLKALPSTNRPRPMRVPAAIEIIMIEAEIAITETALTP